MRRAIKLTALGLMGAIALTVASYLTLVAVAFFESGAGPHQSYARFESARPAEVIVPQSDPAAATEQLSELVRRAATEGRKVSIAGSQHSMGGHTLVDAGWLVDMRCDAFRQIDSVEVRGSRATVHVGSGATWHEVLLALDQQGWSVDVMQSNDDFTVGGSISVNCHGWNPATESIASTVDSFTLIKADGSIVQCRRDRPQDHELFGAVCGGYGLLGIITSVELRVVPNALYRAEEFSASAANYTLRPSSLPPTSRSDSLIAASVLRPGPGF